MTHVPPIRASASITRAPWPAAMRAARPPPDPHPITTRSVSNGSAAEEREAQRTSSAASMTGQIPGDGAGYDNLRHFSCVCVHHNARPPSTTMVVPVENRRWVAHAKMPAAISSGSAIRLRGVVVDTLSLKLASRPGTNVVSTTPGAMARTRTCGAGTRAGVWYRRCRLGRTIGNR